MTFKEYKERRTKVSKLKRIAMFLFRDSCGIPLFMIVVLLIIIIGKLTNQF